jgi:ribosomal protein L1
MDDKKLEENVISVIRSIEGLLPDHHNNVKNVMIKFTMTKPLEVKA